MTSYRHAEFSLADGHEALEDDNDCLHAAATLLQQMAVEVEPLAKLNAAMATAIEDLRRDVEALIPIVDFIPIASDATCLIELKQLARRRIGGLVEKLQSIAQQAELFARERLLGCTFSGDAS